MSDSDIDDTARFMLRHFGGEARAAAMGIEIDAALNSEHEKMARWSRIGETIAALQAGGILDVFAAEAVAVTALSKRRRRVTRAPVAAPVVSAPEPAVTEQRPGRASTVPYLRLVVG